MEGVIYMSERSELHFANFMKKYNEDHIIRLWVALEQAALARKLSEVIFFAGRLVDNLVVQPELPIVQLEEVETPAIKP